MNKYFSGSALGFYIEGTSLVIPEDALIVSDSVYQEFTNVAWPEGKVLGTDAGMPAWIDAPPLTHEEEVENADEKKQSLIEQANAYINSKQWPGKASLGRLTDDELIQYNIWLDYLDELEAIDTSKAPDITWPDKPE
ncbi:MULTISPECIES: tail fiber assembly protein [unclassified Enterobacter]|uniref:tail fiber assembly protein n=1 Tax=unclassified Enterobacter TaxID=2608935 RepID=UPI00292BAD2D|nr:tail fiber assembly protein [Enterobacter sp. 23-M-SZ-13]MDV0595751.1 tail fiber assembly protein [Enterobacter sp. 23-M-SZ-13]